MTVEKMHALMDEGQQIANALKQALKEEGATDQQAEDASSTFAITFLGQSGVMAEFR